MEPLIGSFSSTAIPSNDHRNRNNQLRLPPKAMNAHSLRLPAMLLGVVLCGVIAVGLPYGECVVLGTRLGLSSSTPAAFFLLFLLVLVLQPVLGTLRRSWLFTRAELLLITVMMMVATAIPTRGFSGVLLPMISGVFYYASPENRWEDQLFPLIPVWLVPDDETAVKGFWEGLPPGAEIPWGVWMPPLLWWLLLMVAFYTVVFCLMVIMRRQWMDHERLLYPLVQVPSNMIADEDRPSRFKPFLKRPLMWLGFSVPFLLHSINSLSHYYQFFPAINPVYPVQVHSAMYPFYFRFSPMWDGAGLFHQHRGGVQPVVLLLARQEPGSTLCPPRGVQSRVSRPLQSHGTDDGHADSPEHGGYDRAGSHGVCGPPAPTSVRSGLPSGTRRPKAMPLASSSRTAPQSSGPSRDWP